MKCFKIDYVPGAPFMPGTQDWVEINIFDFNQYMNKFHYGNAFGGDKCVGFSLINYADLDKGAPGILIYQVRSDDDMKKFLGDVHAK